MTEYLGRLFANSNQSREQRIEVKRERRVDHTRVIRDGISASARIDDVDASAAVESVVAGVAQQRVDPGVTFQRIGARGPNQQVVTDARTSE